MELIFALLALLALVLLDLAAARWGVDSRDLLRRDRDLSTTSTTDGEKSQSHLSQRGRLSRLDGDDRPS